MDKYYHVDLCWEQIWTSSWMKIDTKILCLFIPLQNLERKFHMLNLIGNENSMELWGAERDPTEWEGQT